MSQSPFPGPIAPFNNPPINPQYYEPSRFQVTSITLGTSTTVTTSVNHNYVIGQQVRILIPLPYGTYQLNEEDGYVTSIPATNQVVVDINSSGFNPFNPTPTYSGNKPEIMAIGDINSPLLNTSRTDNSTFIQGSFINISPE